MIGPDDQTSASVPHHRVRGRGSGVNPANRYVGLSLSVLGETLDDDARTNPNGAQVRTQILTDATRRIINRVDNAASPDIPFTWTINPYRGCEHGCTYCYARPYHEQLGFSCGLDFETKIVAKRDAPAMLARELDAHGWTGQPIVMSGVTDPYQPVERELRITRGCLEVMAERAQPVSLITKNSLIVRDVDLLAELAKVRAASAALSVTTLDPRLARSMEPRACAPMARLRAIETLANAGVPVMVMVAPIAPGLNDHEIPSILSAVKDAGASGANWVLLRLPHQVRDVFLDWLAREWPDRAARVESAIRESRDGRLSDPKQFSRHRGSGVRAEQIARTFEVFARRHGLDGHPPPLSSEAFNARRRQRDDQGWLFA